MKGKRSHNPVLIILGLFAIVAISVIGLSIYATNMIWPEQAEIDAYYAEQLALVQENDTEAIPLQTEPLHSEPPFAHGINPAKPVFVEKETDTVLAAVDDDPKLPSIQIASMAPPTIGTELGDQNDLNPIAPRVIALRVPPSHEAVDEKLVSAFSLGVTNEGLPAVLPDRFSPQKLDEVTKTVTPIDFDIDVIIAALDNARPTAVDTHSKTAGFDLALTDEILTTDEVFVLADTSELVTEWPQRVDHDAVLVVSQMIPSPMVAAQPMVAKLPSTPALSLTAPQMSQPEIQLASLSAQDMSPPPMTRKQAPSIASAPTATPMYHQALMPADGRNRLSVLGVFQAPKTAWALIELSDGRIIKATKGTSLADFKVSRIRGDRIWIRMGGTEKGLKSGQVVVLN